MSFEYGFSERMVMSNGVVATTNIEEILTEHLPGITQVVRASADEDRSGTDWWACTTARRLSIDAKVREQDWSLKNRDDLALEIYSVESEYDRDGAWLPIPEERRKVGWTRDANKTTDYVLWLWKDTGRFCLVPFPMLCRIYDDLWASWFFDYGSSRQRTPFKKGQRGFNDDAVGYHSECSVIPRRMVWSEIYKRYSPNIAPD